MNEERQGLLDRSVTLSGWIDQYIGKDVIRGAEIGVYLARLSRNLLARFDNLHLYMVDKWEPIPAESTAGKAGDGLVSLPPHNWHMVYACAIAVTAFAKDRTTVIRKDSVEAARDVPDGSLDFVFIDADHSYEGCIADLRAWIPKVSEKGIVCGHDYSVPGYPLWGVRRALDELAPKDLILGLNYTWCFKKSWFHNEL